MTTGTPQPKRGGPKCGGRKRDGSGDRCTLTAGWGTDHPGIGACKLHGGSTPGARKAAITAGARSLIQAHAINRPNVDPVRAVLEEIGRCAGVIDWLRTKIESLDAESLVRGTRMVRRTEDPEGTTTVTEVGPGLNIWWQMYERERDRLVRVSKAAHDMGIADQQVALAEQHGMRIAAGIQWMLRKLGREDDPTAMQAAVEMLEGLDSGRWA
jgi:hypothetical protein